MTGAPSDDYELPSLTLDMEAADRVMTCGKMGLRAYAEAGGLDPASDFRGLDLRGWELAGQDLRGFDLAGCDLRATGIEFALVDGSTRLKGAVWDEAVAPGDRPEGPALTSADLAKIVRVAGTLHSRNQTKDLAAAGQSLYPLLESLFGPDDPQIRLLAGYVGFGEVREGSPSVGRARLTAIIDCERMVGGADDDTQMLLWRFYSAEASLYLGRPEEAISEFDVLLPLYEAQQSARGRGALTTRYLRAQALLNLGRAKEALAEFDALLPVDEAVRGARHPDTLSTRYLRARALLDLDRTNEALAEFDALLPLDDAVRGARDPSTLNTRHLRAIALLDLGRANEALAEFDALLPLDDAVRGARDPSTLITRHLRARALLDLGRANEALAEFDALLPLDEAVRGARDPSTLITREYRARALLDLGRANEAVADFGLVVMGYKAAKGENHWWVSAARSDEIGSRMALGERGFAAELERIANHIGRERYPHTDSALRTHYRIVRDLVDTGETDKARVEAAVVSALCSDPVVARHRYVNAALDLIAGLEVKGKSTGRLN